MGTAIKSVFFTKIKRGAKFTDRNITQTTYKKSKNVIVLSPTEAKNGVKNKKQRNSKSN